LEGQDIQISNQFDESYHETRRHLGTSVLGSRCITRAFSLSPIVMGGIYSSQQPSRDQGLDSLEALALQQGQHRVREGAAVLDAGPMPGMALVHSTW
jgi:hypothetical protein